MTYHILGLMSGSSLDGLDIAFVEFEKKNTQWTYNIIACDCIAYSTKWIEKLKQSPLLNGLELHLLDIELGQYISTIVNQFIATHNIKKQITAIVLHGHTVFHLPQKHLTLQIGNGGAIAAKMQIPTITHLRQMDVQYGGQGAPIIPIGEKYLFANNDFFLNIGGICNISCHLNKNKIIGFDIAPANAILNFLAQKKNKSFDNKGFWAQQGKCNETLLTHLNQLEYYHLPYPKSLANQYAVNNILPLLQACDDSIENKLHTYCKHIALQVFDAIKNLIETSKVLQNQYTLYITGGGAFNTFLINCIKQKLNDLSVNIIIPDEQTIKFKEAIVMGFIGVLRLRNEENVLQSVTNAKRNTINGIIWQP